MYNALSEYSQIYCKADFSLENFNLMIMPIRDIKF